jgi:hypothetical protein
MDEKHALIGQRGQIEFPEAVATVDYISEKSLKWRTVDKNGTISEAIETIDYERVAPHLHFLNWIEKDGWTVSQIIDTKSGTVKAYWSFDDNKSERGNRSAIFVSGSFAFIF